MSDLLDRLQDMVDFKHDDMDVAREAIEEIVKLEAQHDEQAATIARLWAKREALQKRVAELETALQFIKDAPDEERKPNFNNMGSYEAGLRYCAAFARAALKGKKDE